MDTEKKFDENKNIFLNNYEFWCIFKAKKKIRSDEMANPGDTTRLLSCKSKSILKRQSNVNEDRLRSYLDLTRFKGFILGLKPKIKSAIFMYSNCIE
ncbi:hypothetical protein BpHYR1_049492 [Brachionus plicatilis]|uniref:Uncharacterized protein n=1 Tax=Brachionus plicatilis TaxID=10195 RepID=A0A3M7S874_BRAPC|nr:hypothetical protein BpHYR1_049492 [Brachionus plicatilis]